MTRVAVAFEWQPIGEVILVDGKPRFPSLPRPLGRTSSRSTSLTLRRACASARPTTFIAERRTIGRQVRRSGRVCA